MEMLERDISSAIDGLSRQLLGERRDGHWEGELSASALSTATACFSLSLYRDATLDATRVAARGQPPIEELDRELDGELDGIIRRGFEWLIVHQNEDGGWGDTTRSISNISTTTLCQAALGAGSALPNSTLANSAPPGSDVAIQRARDWIETKIGSAKPEHLASAIVEVYGKDRTFSIPILTMCALAGCLGEPRQAWSRVMPLPFEFAALPQSLFRHIGLPVVSYALPALIAIGQVRNHHKPPTNPFIRALRSLTRNRTLRVLGRIQPESGGFLEATPLTSFVAMSLIGSGRVTHVVTRHSIEFLRRSARDDGSWAIDTNLATWVTSLSIHALSRSHRLQSIGEEDRAKLLSWILDQQYDTVHAYTGAAPGGWAWTDLSGGVPDADDTPGALLALRVLWRDEERIRHAAANGLRWLLDLQNRDGGMPTFCRGSGNLPFDRSGSDLTAHALRACLAWRDDLPPGSNVKRAEIDKSSRRMIDYLLSTQESDGSWIPLWFGNQFAVENRNATYGTAKVLLGLEVWREKNGLGVDDAVARAQRFLVASQHSDGGWGAGTETPSTIEETSLAVESLAVSAPAIDETTRGAIERGTRWLLSQLAREEPLEAAPIGFYFANLWYYEKLYPQTFALAALGRARRALNGK